MQFTAQMIAGLIGGTIVGDPEAKVNNFAKIEEGKPGCISFLANDKSPTFGIMGVSPLGAYKCVVSSKLPKTGAEHTEDNFRKLALHELGHAFGLNHCPNQHCYMVDAEHKMKFPQTTGFCELCSKTLNSKGWKISVTPNTNMG